MRWAWRGGSPHACGSIFLDKLIFFVKALVAFLLLVAAVMDYRTRKVSNWISLPLFFGSLIAFPCLPADLGTRVFALLFSILLFWLWKVRWMGGADAKVLIALTLAWLPAAMLSMLSISFFGLFTRLKNQKTLAGLIPIAFGAALTFGAEVSIMFSN